VDDRALSELRDLARRDAELEARAGELRARDGEVQELRRRAETILAFFATLDDEQERRGAFVAAARAELAGRHDELERASADLARSHDEEARFHAQHAVDRAHDHIAIARKNLARTEAVVAELHRDAIELRDELAELERVPDTGVAGAQGLIDWASREHAELFVAVGQLDVQRELVIREANEIATMLLGEQTFGVPVAQALARVESYWTSVPGQVSESR
jgi:DNA repair exonuclease SbcCD ATPase subunit